MLEKDLKLFWRDKRTVLLVILAPIIIMLVLANIFNVPDTKESIKGITIGLCNQDRESVDLETDVFDVFVLNQPCEQQAQEMVSKGELRIAAIIPPGFFSDIQEGKGTSLTTYVDNSKGQIALVSSAAIKGFVSDLNEQIGTTFILSAWDALGELNRNLKELITKMDEGFTLVERTKERTKDLQVDLSELDPPTLKAQITTANTTIALAQTSLNQAIVLLSLPVTPPLPEIDTSDAVDFHAEYCGNYTALNATPFENMTEAAWQTMCAPIGDALTWPNALNISLPTNQTDSVLDILQPTLDQLTEVQKSLDALMVAVLLLEDVQQQSEEDVLKFNDIVTNYERDMRKLRNDLTRTTRILDDYTSRDPKNIIRAVSLDENSVFQERKVLEFMLPGIVALILLFVTMFISSSVVVGERLGGTMARNFLSPISVIFFLFEKVLYLLVLSAIQLASMTVVSHVLGVPLTWSLELLVVLLLVSFSFIAMGMLIGALSKSENAALLTSLVVGLPMLFLSGLFFPFEIMPEVMRNIGGYLPLTLSISLLDQLLIYALPLELTSLGLLGGISLGLFLLAALFIHRSPMAD